MVIGYQSGCPAANVSGSPRLLDSVFSFFSGRVAGGGQFAGGAAPEMEVVDDVGEVAFGIEAVQAGRLNNRRERGVGFGAFDRGAEKTIFAMQGVGAHGAFGAIIINGRGADGDVGNKPVPLVEGVGRRAADAGFR